MAVTWPGALTVGATEAFDDNAVRGLLDRCRPAIAAEFAKIS